jgi:hypothetical protein
VINHLRNDTNTFLLTETLGKGATPLGKVVGDAERHDDWQRRKSMARKFSWIVVLSFFPLLSVNGTPQCDESRSGYATTMEGLAMTARDVVPSERSDNNMRSQRQFSAPS